MKPKKNPQDATRRNVQSANKRIAALEKKFGLFALDLKTLGVMVGMLLVQGARQSKRSKRK